MADDAITFAPNPASAAPAASSPIVPSAPINIPNSIGRRPVVHYTDLPEPHQSISPPQDSLLPTTAYGTGLDDGPIQNDLQAARAAADVPSLQELDFQPPNDNYPLAHLRRQPGEPVFCRCAGPRAASLKTFHVHQTLRGRALWARFLAFANTGNPSAVPSNSVLRRLLPIDRAHVVRVGEIADTQDIFAPPAISWFGLCEARAVDPEGGEWRFVGKGNGRGQMVYEEILEGRGGYLGLGEMRLETVLARVVKCELCMRVWEVRILK